MNSHNGSTPRTAAEYIAAINNDIECIITHMSMCKDPKRTAAFNKLHSAQIEFMLNPTLVNYNKMMDLIKEYYQV